MNTFNVVNYFQTMPFALTSEKIASIAKAEVAPSTADLVPIMDALAEANALFRDGKYEAAIPAYEHVLALISNSDDPPRRLSVHGSMRLRAPQTKIMVEHLLTTVANRLKNIDPSQPPGPFPTEIGESEWAQEIKPYALLGITYSQPESFDVRGVVHVVDSAIERGEWDTAARLYKNALTSLSTGKPKSGSDESLIAGLKLNLGATLVQTGEFKKAHQQLLSAATSFKALGNSLGEAEANFNLAAAYAGMNNLKGAATYAKSGATLLENQSTSPQKTETKTLYFKETSSLTELGQRAGSGVVLHDITGSMQPRVLERVAHYSDKSTVSKQYGFQRGTEVVTVSLHGTSKTIAKALIREAYVKRNIDDLQAATPPFNTLPDFAVGQAALRHFYIPVTIGDCHRFLGHHALARKEYLYAVDYPEIHNDFAIPLLWQHIAETALNEGDEAYSNDDPQTALTAYRLVLESPSAGIMPENSPLYSHPDLKKVGNEVVNLIKKIDSGVEMGTLSHHLVAVVLTIRARLMQIDASLDFNGYPAKWVPIWSFGYLQDIARYFTRQAQQAERDFISFREKFDQAVMTRKQLESAKSIAEAEVVQAGLQIDAANSELDVYLGPVIASGNDGTQTPGQPFLSQGTNFTDNGVSPGDAIRIGINPADKEDSNPVYYINSVENTRLQLDKQPQAGANLHWAVYRNIASLRRKNAEDNRDAFASMTDEQIDLDRQMAYYNAPGWQSGTKVDFGLGDNNPKASEVMAGLSVTRGTITKDYQVGSMNRQIDELSAAEGDAQLQIKSAKARVAVAEQMKKVAELRSQAANESLEAYDEQLFSADAWLRMSEFMRQLSDRQLARATDIARLMQLAYNFENDDTRKDIWPSYFHAGEAVGIYYVLRADALMEDIDKFTYSLVMDLNQKQSPIRQTISLAEEYPYLFETDFRRSGRMMFDTRLEQFDMEYPGTFQARIATVDIEVSGLIPMSGIRGSLTNSGLSVYRSAERGAPVKYRFQPKDTQIISEYHVKQDSFIYPPQQGRIGIFEGAGVAGSWVLDIPPAVNNIDYRSIIDIRLTFYYRAFFDGALAERVKKELTDKNAKITSRTRSISLRWAFPDAFFSFQETGELPFSLGTVDFPYNEIDPKITHLAMVIHTTGQVDPRLWRVTLNVPGKKPPVTAVPDVKGEIRSPGLLDKGSWKTLTGDSAVGNYSVKFESKKTTPSVSGPTPLPDPRNLKLPQIENIVLIMEYSFTPREVN